MSEEINGVWGVNVVNELVWKDGCVVCDEMKML